MTEEKTHWRRLVDVFDRDHKNMTRFVQSKLYGDVLSDAEDIVSDVFLRLLERTDLLAQIEDLTGYLYTALNHRIIDLYRRLRTRPPRPLEDYNQAIANADSVDPTPDPEQSAVQREQVSQLYKALAAIPAAERAIWVAVEIEGLTFQEIANRWKKPIGTLLSRKSRAAKKLRLLLADKIIPTH